MNTEYYKNFENIFAHSSVPWQQEILKQLLKKMGTTDSTLVADIGAGIGNNIKTIAEFTHHITAVDISQDALNFLKKKYSGIGGLSTVQADASKLPFQTEAFDVVIITEVLEHCENPEQALSECVRILKPGGYIIASTPNYLNPAGLWKKIWDSVHSKSSWDAWGNHKKGVENLFTSIKLKRLLESQKIKISEELGGDLLRSWLPFLRRYYNFIDRHPFLSLGKVWPVKYLMMNYFVLGRKSN